MAKACAITKKTSKSAGGYANRTRATVFTPTGTVRKYANLQKKRVFVPELNKSVTITVSTKGLRTMQKKGVYAALREAGVVK
jgi:large subunit ribosomal protein L28